MKRYSEKQNKQVDIAERVFLFSNEGAQRRIDREKRNRKKNPLRMRTAHVA